MHVTPGHADGWYDAVVAGAVVVEFVAVVETSVLRPAVGAVVYDAEIAAAVAKRSALKSAVEVACGVTSGFVAVEVHFVPTVTGCNLEMAHLSCYVEDAAAADVLKVSFDDVPSACEGQVDGVEKCVHCAVLADFHIDANHCAGQLTDEKHPVVQVLDVPARNHLWLLHGD